MKKRWFGIKARTYSSRVTLEQLEERIVLDASVPATSVDNPDNPENTQTQQEAQQATTPEAHNAPTQAAADAATSHDPLGDIYTADAANVLVSHDLGAVDSVSTDALRAVVVSSDIKDGADLVAAVQDNVITITYDAATANTDTILSAIDSALHGKTVDSIAFITHDNGAGAFSLTQDVSVSFNTITSDASLQGFWSAVGAYVQTDGRIDIMACDVASTQEGLDLVAQLETLTGRNVAASVDDTGNELFGGNWELETDNVSLVPAYFDPHAVQFFDGKLDVPGTVVDSYDLDNTGTLTVSAIDGVLANDEGYGAGLTAILVTDQGPQHGTLVLALNGSFTYTPEVGYTGSDSFQYKAYDGTDYSLPTTVTLTVYGLNHAPVAQVSSVTATEDTPFTSFTSTSFNFSDAEHNPLAGIKITSLPANGTLLLGETSVTVNGIILADQISTLSFQGAQNFNGSTSFDFKVFDGTNWSDASGLMTVNVSAVNDAPNATGGVNIPVGENGIHTITLGDIGFTDVNDVPANDLDSVRITELPANGSLTINGVNVVIGTNDSISKTDIVSGKLQYTANEDNNNYTDGFKFVVTDNGGGSTNTDLTANTISFSVTAPNDLATITGGDSLYYTVLTDSPVNLGSITVDDVESENITVTLTVQDPSENYNVVGKLRVGQDGTLSETLTFTGTDTQVNTWLDSVNFVPKTGYGQDVQIKLDIEDGTADVSKTFTIYANHMPIFKNPGGLVNPVEYDEGQYSVYLPDLRVNDFDANATITATITLNDISTGYLTTRDNMFGGTYTPGTHTGVWEMTGSLESVNNALNNMVFMPTGENDVNTSVTVNITDGITHPDAIETNTTINLNVVASNDQPYFSDTPGASISIDDGTGTQSALIKSDAGHFFQVNDVDTGEQVTVTLRLSDATAGYMTIPADTTDGTYSRVQKGPGVWEITGDVEGVNNALKVIAYNYDPTKALSNNLTIQVQDGGENNTQISQSSIQLVFDANREGNDPLSATFYIDGATVSLSPSPTVKYQEGFSNVYLPAMVVSDDDPDQKLSATITVTASGIDSEDIESVVGHIESYSVSTLLTHASGENTWTVEKLTVAQMNALLGHLKFMPAGENDIDANVNIEVKEVDSDGVQIDDTIPVSANITLDVFTTNDQPVFTDLPDTVISFDGGDLTGGVAIKSSTQYFDSILGQLKTIDHAIVVDDPDSVETVTVTLTLSDATAGSLFLDSAADPAPTLPLDHLSGAVWELQGSVSDVNTALAALKFDPNDDNPKSVTLTVDLNDGREDFTQVRTEYIQLQFTADNPDVNDPLSGSFFIDGQNVALTTTPSVDYQEGFTNVYLPGIVVSDADSGQLLTATLTLNKDVGYVQTYGTAEAVTTVSGTEWKLSGLTVSEMNYALSHLKFMPGSDNDQDAKLTITISQVDEDGDLIAGSNTVTGEINLNVFETNDQPVFSQFPASVITVKDGVTNTPIGAVGSYIQVNDVDTGEQLTVTLRLADKDAGSLSVISDLDGTANGSYTVDTVAGVVTITGDQTGVNNALKTLAYVKTLDVTNGLTVELKDGGEDYTGVRTGYIELQFDPDAAGNDPVGLSYTATVNYDEGYNNVYLPALVVSNDDVGQTLSATFSLSNASTGYIQTYGTAQTLVSGVAGTWTLSNLTLEQMNFALSHLKFMPASDNDEDATLTIRVVDDPVLINGIVTVPGGNENVATITLDVNPINDQPTFTDLPPTNITMPEGQTTVYIYTPDHSIKIADPDHGDIVYATLRLSDLSTGQLSVIKPGDSARTTSLDSGELVVSGTTAQVETALKTLQFNQNVDNDRSAFITVAINDGGENGTMVLTERINLQFVADNDHEISVTASPITITAGTSPIPLPDLVISDGDEDVTVTLSADIGKEYASIQRDGVMDGLYDPATGKWEITGSLSQVNQALADVMFVPDNGFSVTTVADGGTTVNVQIRDESGDTKNGKIWIVDNTSFFELL